LPGSWLTLLISAIVAGTVADMVDRSARVGDVHEIATAMPHVTRIEGPKGNAIYQVGGKSFVFFRTPQPDAADPVTGERYTDVIMLWVGSADGRLERGSTRAPASWSSAQIPRPAAMALDGMLCMQNL
jgi:hypothetical protein